MYSVAFQKKKGKTIKEEKYFCIHPPTQFSVQRAKESNRYQGEKQSFSGGGKEKLRHVPRNI
jgi:hypothetical protein